MKTFLKNIIPKIQNFDKKIDNAAILTGRQWIVLDDENKNITTYIFRGNNELIVSVNNNVNKWGWELIGTNSILIEKDDESFLLKQGFFDEDIFVLKIDSEDYLILLNEEIYNQGIKSISSLDVYLENKYLSKEIIDQESEMPGSHNFFIYLIVGVVVGSIIIGIINSQA